MVMLPLLPTSQVTESIIHEVLHERILENRKSEERIFCVIISVLISIER